MVVLLWGPYLTLCNFSWSVLLNQKCPYNPQMNPESWIERRDLHPDRQHPAIICERVMTNLNDRIVRRNRNRLLCRLLLFILKLEMSLKLIIILKIFELKQVYIWFHCNFYSDNQLKRNLISPNRFSCVSIRYCSERTLVFVYVAQLNAGHQHIHKTGCGVWPNGMNPPDIRLQRSPHITRMRLTAAVYDLLHLILLIFQFCMIRFIFL